MDCFTQAKIYDTSSPSNVYTTTIMRMVNGDQKMLMISAEKNNIITVESKRVNDDFETCIVDANFPNIPSDAEIISIHCINRSKESNDDFVIGLTYALTVEDQDSEIYFNIYSGFSGSSLEVIKNFETFKLDFLPFQLNHAIYTRETQKKGMWLISGSDRKIHAYKSDEQVICEEKIEEYFIEYKDEKDSIVLCFSTKSFNNYKKRVSFYGCETGYSMLAIVDSEKNQILYCFAELYLSPVTVVQLFNIYNRTVKVGDLISDSTDHYIPDYDTVNEKEQVCLLVAAECAVVYMNVLENNLECAITLTNSINTLIVTSLIADINFDSKNEILLGTYKHYILSYVYENDTWEEQQKLDIRHPVYTICYLDINGEGVNDMVVMSGRGIHIFKHEPKDLILLLQERLKTLEIIDPV